MLPAYAGMDLARVTPCNSFPDAPRIRGDGPISFAVAYAAS